MSFVTSARLRRWCAAVDVVHHTWVRAFRGPFRLGRLLPWRRKRKPGKKERFETGTEGGNGPLGHREGRWARGTCSCKWVYGVRRADKSGTCGRTDPQERWKDPSFVLCIVVVAEEGANLTLSCVRSPSLSFPPPILFHAPGRRASHTWRPPLSSPVLPTPLTFAILPHGTACVHGEAVERLAVAGPAWTTPPPPILRHHRRPPFRCPDGTRVETGGVGNETRFETDRTRTDWERGWYATPRGT